MKAKKIIRNFLLGIIGVFVLLLVAVQIVLSPKFLTKMVNKYAADYVDGTIHIDKVRASVFRSFPYLNLLADGFSITYPHEKFSQYDGLCTETGRFALVNRGRGEVEDTLASFRRLDVSVNAMALLGKKVDIRKALIYSPRIFAHYYDSTAANWNIIKIESSQDTTSSGESMPIIVRKAGLLERPYVVFTNPADTLHALIAMKDIMFKGELNTADILHTRWGLDVDSLFVSGRLPADTLALGLDHMGLHGGNESLVLDARSKAYIASSSLGRMVLPIGLLAQGSLPDREDGAVEVKVDTAALSAASLVLKARGDVVLHEDRTSVNANARIDDTPLTSIANDFGALVPELRKIHTSAILSLQADCNGDFVPAENRIPDISARLRIPRTDIAYEDIPYRGYTELDVTAATDSCYKLNVDIEKLILDIFGISLDLGGGADDALGGDPFIRLNGSIGADLATVLQTFTAEDGITGTGSLNGHIGASTHLSRLSAPGGISNIDLDCKARANHLRVYDRPDSITAFIPSGSLTIRTVGRGRKTLGINAFLDTLSVRSGKSMMVRGHGVSINTNNLVKLVQDGPQAVSASLKAHRLAVRDNASISALLGDLNFSLSARPHASVTKAKSRRTRYLDSLQRVYPGVPRDTLIAVMHRTRRLPVWMQEEEFRQHDINITLDESLAQYVRNWDFNGNIGLGRARFRIPDFPLVNRISSVGGSFSNDSVVIDSLTLQSGESDISANLTVTGLRRALLRKGLIRVDANVTSDYIDANEIMRAYAWSQTEGMDKHITDEPAAADIPDSVKYALLVVPGNLIANIGLEANQIRYDSLLVTWAASDIAIKQRTMQITNTVATSNMGDIYFEGFYSTLAKDDIKAGFDLNLVDVTAEKVINLFPALDTITPMLKSFGGYLDCEVAATSELDTNMNFITSSIDGIMKISGKDLSIRNSPEFRRIASLLLFRNRREAVIDNMSVTGMIRDNTLEVFPFVLAVDRYVLAASGIQNMDESFRYHFSVIKSPVLVKFGVNMWGQDFNHIKWGLGWPKYRSANVPVFTSQMHDVQYNLLGSIHNIFDIGVERAMEENRNQNLIADEMARLNYTSEIDTTENQHFRDSVMTILQMHDDVEESVEERLERLRGEVLTEEENASRKGDMKKEDDDVQQ